MRPVDQHLLAKQLKLSRTTVSRSLSNHPAISAETRSRVQALAAQLGYRSAPTRAVRRPRDAKPITIGVLIGAPLVAADRATFPTILRGIRHRAAIEHAAVDVVSIDPAEFTPAAAQKHIFRLIRSAQWRGAILIYPLAEPVIRALSDKISIVSALTEYADARIDVVDTDHHGVVSAVERLIKLGHRKIGFLSWHYPVGGVWAQRRFGAYAEALHQQGRSIDPKYVLNIRSAADRILSPAELADFVAISARRDGVTGWVCAADHQAYQLISDLRGRGLRVPEDVSVTGFDGNEPPPGLPALTTLRVPNEQVGESAVAQLISRLLYPRSVRRKILIETSLVIGSSTAAAPKR
ncbi:MAG TPA: LacI family DNA-binding transcriptional regulator [Opitutaceae bacterium]|nr:LacI family DNA-binding transcriptional regulator [Opitutaceae bacterium]